MPKLKLNDPFIRNHPAPEKRIEIYDELAEGLAVRITKTGHKSFVYRYRFNNKVKRYTIGKFPKIGLSKARDIAGDLSYLINIEGKDPLIERRKAKHNPDPITFKDLAQEFKDKYFPTLREATQQNYRYIIDNELVPKLGSQLIKDIEKNQIISLLDRKAYKNGTPTMANKMRAQLSRIYTFGMERGIVDKNPVASTSTYKKGKGKRARYYNDEEIRELWKYFEMANEPTQSVFKMLLITGQRKTETMCMKWDDIEGDIWSIPAELAKNGKQHLVPLSGMAQEIIEEIRPLTGKTDYVFCSPKQDNAPMKWLTRARETIKNESEVPDFRPHDLRRTVATYMAKLGIQRTVLGKILNHKGLAGDTQVTAIYDRHTYMEEKSQAMNRWASHLQNILENEKAKITRIA